MSEQYTVQVKKRPWYAWVLWVLWLVLLFFMLQNAIASSGELETRATIIFWISTVVWFLAGIVIWFTRRGK